MDQEALHREALEALLTVATSPERWPSRSELARDCGFAPSTLSNATSGRRGLSDDAAAALCRVLGIQPEALRIPWRAQPGDLRTEAICDELAETQRLLTRVHRRVKDYERGEAL